MNLIVQFMEKLAVFAMLILVGPSGENTVLRIVLIGFLLGLIGGLSGLWAFAFIALGLAVYIWLFSLWHPEFKEVSRFFFGQMVILGVVLSVMWLGAGATVRWA